MKPLAIHRTENLAGKILCHDLRPAFRKGHKLRAEDIPVLMAASRSEIHLIVTISNEDLATRRRRHPEPRTDNRQPTTGFQ